MKTVLMIFFFFISTTLMSQITPPVNNAEQVLLDINGNPLQPGWAIEDSEGIWEWLEKEHRVQPAPQPFSSTWIEKGGRGWLIVIDGNEILRLTPDGEVFVNGVPSTIPKYEVLNLFKVIEKAFEEKY
jgi:hypothetical protein